MSDREVSVVIRAKDAVAGGLASAKSKIGGWASAIGGMLTGALAGVSLGAFASRAVDEVLGAERALSQLGNSLANVGVDFSRVRPEINETIAAIQRTAAIDDDDAIAALNKLVQVSGNYSGSLRNLALVTDVAAAKGIDLSEAATLVGKVMAGTGSKGLKDFGIATKDPIDGIEQLRAKVKGAAETELATLGGALKAANIGLGDVAQAAGQVVAESPAFQSFLRTVIDGFRDGTEWIVRNKAQLGVYASTAIDAFVFVGKAVRGLVTIVDSGLKSVGAGLNKFEKELTASFLRTFNVIPVAINELIEMANRLPGVDIKVRMPELSGMIGELSLEADQARQAMLTHAGAAWSAMEGISAAWDAIGDSADKASDAQVGGLQRTREELDRNRKAHDALRAAQLREEEDKVKGRGVAGLRSAIDKAAKARGGDGDLEVSDRHARLGTDAIELPGATGERDAEATGKSVKIDPMKGPQFGFMDALAARWEQHRQQILETGDAYKTFGQNLADVVAGPIAQFGESTLMAMGAMIVGSRNAGAAFRSSMLQALSGVAKMEGDYFIGKAIAATGDAALGNPFAIFAQGKYLAAAAAMYAVSGGASALAASGGGGGGGGAGGGGQGVGRSGSGTSTGDQGKVTVVLSGRRLLLDTADPADREMFADMVKELTGTREVEFVIRGEND